MLNSIESISRYQLTYLINLIYSGSMVTPPLVSVTLDKDDVTLARKLLKNRKTWEDKSLVSSYEAEFSEWNGSKFVFAFIKGRVALSACIYALGLRPGDEVILPGYTCVVVPNALHFAGLKTVFSDIELDTFGLDASQIENKITSKTRAILIQHLYGLICRDYEALIDIANKYNLKVIEDCAHATGAEFNNQKVGNLGDCAFYSSEKSKIFTTIQGGVAVTNEQEIANKLEEFSNSLDNPDDIFVEKLLNNVIINYYKYKHPQRWWLGMLVSLNKHRKHLISTTVEEQRGIKPLHYGRKMPPPVAMLGSNQLKKIDAYNNSRRETSDRWKKWCLENGYKPPFIKPGSLPVFLRYPLLVEPYKKQNTHWALIDPGVRLGVWFKGNHHPINKPIRNCPKADIAVKQCVNLPGVLE